ncbi:hypothetical protein C9374_014013 [Naegleria lovaniensis]|uniref:Uncharacterized protein n=1 Tax=Naegleria lovaniensis TaxID=51637 RepID=A0AA88KPH3_NAELO|nr:uncharacterized protein C9374_014013 [Naegleria lovaniensis]KAG2389453.1 hypothetical protein C9374_014013 [Naegleria lovaniensis]
MISLSTQYPLDTYSVTTSNKSSNMTTTTTTTTTTTSTSTTPIIIMDHSQRFQSHSSHDYIYERIKYQSVNSHDNNQEMNHSSTPLVYNGIIVFVHNFGSHSELIVDDSLEKDWIDSILIRQYNFIVYRFDLRGHGRSSGSRFFINTTSSSSSSSSSGSSSGSSSSTSHMHTEIPYLQDLYQVVNERIPMHWKTILRRLLKHSMNEDTTNSSTTTTSSGTSTTSSQHIHSMNIPPIVFIGDVLGGLLTLRLEQLRHAPSFDPSSSSQHHFHHILLSCPLLASPHQLYQDETKFEKSPEKMLSPSKDLLMRIMTYYLPSYPTHSLLPPIEYMTKNRKRIQKIMNDPYRYKGASIFAEEELYELLVNRLVNPFSNTSQSTFAKYTISGIAGIELRQMPNMWTVSTAKAILSLLEEVNKSESLRLLKGVKNLLVLHGKNDVLTPVNNLKRLITLSQCSNGCSRELIDYDHAMIDLLDGSSSSQKVVADINQWLEKHVLRDQ